MEAVREARRCLADGEIAARSQAITKACSILMELAGALDHARGGAISQRLVQLYDYMQRRLLEANFMQSDAPLHEVLGLLATLSDAWNGVHQQAANSVENRWMPVPQEPPVEYSARAWSF
jgi:flagellar protein FliS